MKSLKKRGIACTVGGCPEIYKEKFFIKNYKNKNDLINTYYLKDKTISFLVDQTVSKKHIYKACKILLNEIENFSKI